MPWDREPECCGEPMRAVEYDSDEDAYLFGCEVNPQSCPTRWFETDDEVWK